MKSRTDFCQLCGLPLRYGSFDRDFGGRTQHFCCIGCRQVYSMLIEASGSADPTRFRESELFKTCRQMGLIPGSEEDLRPGAAARAEVAPVRSPIRSGREEEQPYSNLLPFEARIDGMWCPACAWIVEAALDRQEGVFDAACNFSTDRVQCRYDPLRTDPDALAAVIRKLGYEAASPGADSFDRGQRRELIRLAVSAFLTLNVMMLSFALYTGFLSRLNEADVRKLSWPVAVMATFVLVYGGRPIFRRAWAGVTSAAFGMEALISIGAGSAYFYSLVNLFSGSIHLYFDTASMLITLVLLGKYLEGRAKHRILRIMESFGKLVPAKVRICTEAFPRGRYVSVEGLDVGDCFLADEDETLPADGLVLEGRASLDESALTGEPAPVIKEPGQRVRSGARVVRGSLKIRAEAVGKESLLGQIVKVVESAMRKRVDLEGGTDRILHWFVPLILALAVATFVTLLKIGLPVEAALVRAVTVLVIACPCALGIAIPLTRVAAVSLAARSGVVVRDFAAFERGANIDTLVFDKTGTLTDGLWRLRRIVALPPYSDGQLLEWAASLEQDSLHVVAMEIKRRAAARGTGTNKVNDMDMSTTTNPTNNVTTEAIAQSIAEQVQHFPDGVVGQINGAEMRIGSRDFVLRTPGLGASLPASLDGEGDPEQSRVFMARGKEPVGMLLFGDTMRPEAALVLADLAGAGYRLAVVSGDSEATTRAVGRRLGVQEAVGGMLPQEKASLLQTLTEQGRRAAMIGDGVNDAPALIEATLGIALYAGSHLGEEAADVTLMRGDLNQVGDFLWMSRQVVRKIHQNLAFAFIYNVVAIPLAVAGLLTPITAVCAMLASSLSVIGNTLLLLGRMESRNEEE